MGIAILLLVLFGLVLLRVRPGFGVLALGVALLLFTTTPAGAELPGWFDRAAVKAGEVVDGAVGHAPGSTARTAPTTAVQSQK